MSRYKIPLSIVIPAHNEERTIGRVISDLRKNFPKSEIVVVDNASTDNTRAIAKRLKVRVVLEERIGKGFAIRTGLMSISPSSPVVFMLDGDDTYGLENLQHSVNEVLNNSVDLIVGTRISDKSNSKGRKESFVPSHKVGNFVLSKINNLLHPSGIEDSLSGWRVMSSPFIKSMPLMSTGFEIEAEINAHAYLLGAKIKNIPVIYKGRPIGSESKLKTYKDGFRILRMKLRSFRSDRPQLAFTILSIPWLIVSTWLVFRSLESYVETGLVLQFPSLIAGIGAFLVALQLSITGMTLQRIMQLRVSLIRKDFANHKRDAF